MDLNDEQYEHELPSSRQAGDPPTDMSSAIHLFKLARFNSEIKCVLYCVDRRYPPYTQPDITQVELWQVDILQRLLQWKAEIPQHPEQSARRHLTILSNIRYHELVMLILRPSPRFHNPPKSSLQKCMASAMECARLYHTLYTTKSLHYGWMSVHSLFVSVITMFYCVWAPQGVADETEFDDLMRALKAASDVLSALGEYWPEASRSRNILDQIATATTRKYTQKYNELRNDTNPPVSSTGVESIDHLSSTQSTDWINVEFPPDNATSILSDNITDDGNLFPPVYGLQDDAFASVDMLSYFFGTQLDSAASTYNPFGGYDATTNGMLENLMNDDSFNWNGL